MNNQTIRIAVLASGNGTNAETLIKYFNYSNRHGKVVLVITNRKKAGVIQRASNYGVPVEYIPSSQIEELLLLILKQYNIDFIALAGFLKKVPENVITEYRNRIVNLHPALLPAYGGKGMYGEHVFKAILKNQENFSGITIHHVNEEYDKGEIIAQFVFPLNPGETLETLAEKTHKAEHRFYPIVIDLLIAQLFLGTERG
ncbi:MAG: phosphoribosylglycinamide formyltransferase [Chlorobi bacterium]|nr:phosphoribosylglycinamide formyltransferase [Chlorobiota bacterium]